MHRNPEREVRRRQHRSMATTEPKTVCVTGASGFIAAFIVEELLARGHTVHGTVRSMSKAAHLRRFAGASERLKLFEADVTDPSSLAAPIAGADVVMHTATPIVIPMEGEEPQTRAEADVQQIGPALDGVIAVIEECRQAGVEQIVLTSSNAAVSYQEHPPPVVDETCWSDTAWLADEQQWYTLAKTLQEKKAWDLCGEYGIKLCTINPPLVWGSVHTSHLNFSHHKLLEVIDGTFDSIVPDQWFFIVDVADVALAHVLAFEDPLAEGRYLTASGKLHMADLCDMLQTMYPQFVSGIPKEVAKGSELDRDTWEFNNSKMAKLLGSVVPVEETLRRTVEALIHNGYTGSSSKI